MLLLDEPLAALDRKLREQMQIEIKELQRSVGITTVFVTHDQEEALALSDRIVVMEAGRIAQVGTPMDVYEKPETRFVSDFIGQTNAISARVVSVEGSLAAVATDENQLLRTRTSVPLQPGDGVQVAIRPEKIVLSPLTSTAAAVLEGTIVGCVYTGAVSYYRLQIGCERINAMIPNGSGAPAKRAWPTGTKVKLDWNVEDTALFKKDA